VTVLTAVHEELGATFRSVEGVRTVADYGSPERAHLAVRNGVGLAELPYAVCRVPGRRRDALAAVFDGTVPTTDGRAAHGRLRDTGVRGEATVLAAADDLLCLVSPGAGAWLCDRTGGRDETDAVAVFDLHGPRATEKLAGVLHGAPAPGERHTFVRGRLREAGVTAVRTDDPAGEEGFVVVCAAADAREVHDTLLVRGPNAAPFGYRTWETLTLEAGTPLPADLRRAGENRIVGLTAGTVLAAGDPVTAAGERVGVVLRGVESPSLDRPVALAALADDGDDLAVGGEPVAVHPLPFVDGSATSGRISEP